MKIARTREQWLGPATRSSQVMVMLTPKTRFGMLVCDGPPENLKEQAGTMSARQRGTHTQRCTGPNQLAQLDAKTELETE
jgi:hypothetical protein